jgi:hypothetical protein
MQLQNQRSLKILNSKDFKNTGRSNITKTALKGFPKEHPDVEYLKYKSFLAVHEISMSRRCPKHNYSIKTFKTLKPLIDFLMTQFSPELLK